MTGQQMCETISHAIRASSGAEVAPEAIWNSSSTGELFHVYEAFEVAALWLTEGLEPPPSA